MLGFGAGDRENSGCDNRRIGSQTQHSSWTCTTASSDALAAGNPKAKIKSRPQQLQQPNAREIAEASAEDSNQEERVSQATRIPAEQRTMDMISYMFPATGSETPPAKTIDWDSFSLL